MLRLRCRLLIAKFATGDLKPWHGKCKTSLENRIFDRVMLNNTSVISLPTPPIIIDHEEDHAKGMRRKHLFAASRGGENYWYNRPSTYILCESCEEAAKNPDIHGPRNNK